MEEVGDNFDDPGSKIGDDFDDRKSFVLDGDGVGVEFIPIESTFWIF